MKKVLFWTIMVVLSIVTWPVEWVCLGLECLRFLKWKLTVRLAQWIGDEDTMDIVDVTIDQFADTLEYVPDKVRDLKS